ncbi:PcfK-like family protein [Lepagella muris]|uniref:Uncharacterized protein n=1 Tax=Lepagella muris TaxID=3032870 RepID=A0AC61RHS5_9BACT|nr:Cas9 inhibitor AcrIIA9 family protein [Lepagella muris]TGY79067.1 hypothetical protein E5331_08360 [Lepagella muris]THG52508.1 hypothetical protein E5984_07635 [Bacteroidales bacterium]TKC54272.1 hypothetical protein E5359_018885 [Bacteroidales bacterium]
MEFTPFETAIKKYLDKRAEEDPQFAASYTKPNKSIEECCKYIFQQVEKNKPKGERCVGVSDDEVFGLAVHYYDEDDIVVDGPKNKVEAVQSPSPEPASSPEKPKQRKPRKPKAAVDPNIPEPLDIPIF